MAARKAKIEKYESKDGFRWRMKATNGKVIADSAEAYSSASALDKAVDSVITAFHKGVGVTEID